jgi:hypothetical protein
MPVAIKGSGGGSVTLDAGAASADTTLTLPNTSGTLLQSGTAVTVAQGGTGAATLAANNVLLGNGTSAVQVVAPGTNGNVLTSNGTTWASTAPTSTIPAKLSTATGSAPSYSARAWVNFNASTGAAVIGNSGNVSSVTYNSTGDFSVNFTTALNDANYAFVGLGSGVGSPAGYCNVAVTSLSSTVARFSTKVEYTGGFGNPTIVSAIAME